MADVKKPTESRGTLSQPSVRMKSRPGKRNKTSPTCGKTNGFKQDQHSHTSLRQLQAKMEAENQQVQELIQPLLDTENGFMKELECFLSQQNVAELRRRELLHKHWTEHVWFPLQKRVEERVSSCSPVEVQLFCCKWKEIKTAYFKDSWYYPCERLRGKKTPLSRETGCKCTWRKPQDISQNYTPLDKCGPSQVNHLPQASSHHPASTSMKITREDKTEQKHASRLDTIPSFIDTTSDGRCLQSSCWFSRRGCRPHPECLQQLS